MIHCSFYLSQKPTTSSSDFMPRSTLHVMFCSIHWSVILVYKREFNMLKKTFYQALPLNHTVCIKDALKTAREQSDEFILKQNQQTYFISSELIRLIWSSTLLTFDICSTVFYREWDNRSCVELISETIIFASRVICNWVQILL